MPRRRDVTRSEFAPRARVTPSTLDRLQAAAQRLDTTPAQLVALAVADFLTRLDYGETNPPQRAA